MTIGSVLFVTGIISIKKSVKELEFLKDEMRLKTIEDLVKFSECMFDICEKHVTEEQLKELEISLNEINDILDEEEREFNKKYFKKNEAN